jgi:hypothetical protein
MRAYSHQGHGPRADQTGRIHISDFRFLRTISLAKRSRSIHWVKDGHAIKCTSRPPFFGGLNRSMQHFILEGKDGVWDGTKIS